MAGYRQHLAFSSLLGAGYGTAAVWPLGFEPVQGTLAGMLAALGGLLPDVDSQSGRPTREIFGLVSALAPLVLMDRLRQWTGSAEGAVLAAIALYLSVRYGGKWLLGKLTVHRGMYHSLPAALIAAELAFLSMGGSEGNVRLLLAGGVLCGFLSHLVLDEIYSVQFNGATVRLAKSAGTALKVFSRSAYATAFTYAVLLVLTWLVAAEQGWLEELPIMEQPPATALPR